MLLKQGETNKGAFYWASTADTLGDPEAAIPSSGVAGGDLVLTEGTETAPADGIHWVRANAASSGGGWSPQSCKQVCEGSGLSCDEAALRSVGSSADGLRSAVEAEHVCALPLLAGCDAAPRMSGIGDGLCWCRPEP